MTCFYSYTVLCVVNKHSRVQWITANIKALTYIISVCVCVFGLLLVALDVLISE